jgi:cyclopropane-fatty-acyl-phospholipid synthase
VRTCAVGGWPGRAAAEIVERLLRGRLDGLGVRLWDGRVLGAADAACTLVLHDAGVLRDLVLRRDPLRLAEAYFREQVDVEGDLHAALGLRGHLEGLRLTTGERLALAWKALALRGPPRAGGELRAARGRRRDARRDIGFHYDVSNDFYRLWLDREMVYSCAYFEDPAHDLDRAQRAKLEHLCRKLRLAPGQRLLDIGCGWGALICHAARHHGVRAHGVTLSRNQYEHVQARIAQEGLAGCVTVELKDYAELDGAGAYDRIVSVGMFEHVGLERLPHYFDTARRLLAPGGLFLNHGITQDGEGWGRTAGTAFINRYVFPGGELDSVGNVQRVMERCRFEILDVEALRPHYALTLRAWVDRLQAAQDAALRLVSPAVYRVWRLYMTACAHAFEAGDVGVYQILAAPRGDGRWPVPLTRRDLYA